MMDSTSFFYQRLPYLEERFRLCSKGSSFMLPLLKKYKKNMEKDRKRILEFKTSLLKRSELVAQKNNGDSYKKKTNLY